MNKKKCSFLIVFTIILSLISGQTVYYAEEHYTIAALNAEYVYDEVNLISTVTMELQLNHIENEVTLILLSKEGSGMSQISLGGDTYNLYYLEQITPDAFNMIYVFEVPLNLSLGGFYIYASAIDNVNPKSLIVEKELVDSIEAIAQPGQELYSTILSVTGTTGTVKYKINNISVDVPEKETLAPDSLLEYVPGQDVFGVDTVDNKYIQVYEINENDVVTGFKEILLTTSMIKYPETVPLINVNVQKGSAVWSTRLTVTGTTGTVKYKITNDDVDVPFQDTYAPEGLLPYVPNEDIVGVHVFNNRYIQVYEIDQANKIVGFQEILLTMDTINIPSFYVMAGPGDTNGTTKLSVEGFMGTLKYMLSEQSITPPQINTVAPENLVTFNNNAEIDVSTNDWKYIGVYDIDNENKVIEFYQFEITAAMVKNLMYTKFNNVSYISQVGDFIVKNGQQIGIDISKYTSLSEYYQNRVQSELINKKEALTANSAVFITMFAAEYNTIISNIEQEQSGGNMSGQRAGSGPSRVSISGTQTGIITPVLPQNDSEMRGTVFTDISDVAWAEEAIVRLHEKSIISGVNEEEFRPSDTVLREQFIKMLVLALDLENDNVPVDFDDVELSQWYSPYISAAVGKGIVFGKGDRKFGIGEKITREEMALMCYRGITAKGIELPSLNDAKQFIDRSDISEYATQAIQKMQQSGIINGNTDNSFRPKSTATRAEAAVIIHSIISRI